MPIEEVIQTGAMMDYVDGACIGCGRVFDGPCDECSPDPGKADIKTYSIQIQIIPTPKSNPFKWEKFELGGLPDGENPTDRDFIECICRNAPSKIDKVVERYRKISGSNQNLETAFNEPFIREKLIEPIIEAKSNFILGNWLSTISVCGTVCESLTLLIWRMSRVQVNVEIDGKNFPEFSKIFEIDVEEMTQHNRLKHLKSLLLITDSEFEKLDRIRDIRNNYVHYFKKIESETRRKNAEEVIKETISAVASVIDIDIVDGKANLSKRLQAYIDRLSSERSTNGS